MGIAFGGEIHPIESKQRGFAFCAWCGEGGPESVAAPPPTGGTRGVMGASAHRPAKLRAPHVRAVEGVRVLRPWGGGSLAFDFNFPQGVGPALYTP